MCYRKVTMGAVMKWKALAAVVAASLLIPALTGPPAAAPALREVMFVGNNWEGPVDVIQSSGTYQKLGRINVIPDRAQRLAEISLTPIKLVYFLGIRNGPGEGH